MELTVFIIRDKNQENLDQGTWGVLMIPQQYECQTIELPWRDNKPNISCLPLGDSYRLIWDKSPKFQRMMFLIAEDIPDRGGFRVHSGNFAGDIDKGFQSHSLGCPLLGRKRAIMSNQKAVLISRPAVKDFENVMAGRSAKLIIKEV